MKFSFRTTCFAIAVLSAAKAAPLPAVEIRTINDIEYVTVDGHQLLLDVSVPRTAQPPQLIVWVHGGAWRSGSRKSVPIQDLLKHGFAIASVDYRLSPVARFPAQVHDIKAAIRYLRARQDDYGYDASKVFIVGSSAGGHLAALVGVTNGHAELEGNVGTHLDQSSAVQGIVDYYGPTNFLTILKQSTPHGLSVRIPALQLLLGSQPEENASLAHLASPVFHVDQHDPPLLLIHGDQDPQVPINQSHELHGKYKELHRPVVFQVIHNGAHGGPQFYDAKQLQQVVQFLKSIE